MNRAVDINTLALVVDVGVAAAFTKDRDYVTEFLVGLLGDEALKIADLD